MLTFPLPYVFVGVLTDMKISCAFRIADGISSEKKRFLPRHDFTILSRSGYKEQFYQDQATKNVYKLHTGKALK